ncbi:MAG: ATPase domain-containing protein [Actinoplanes sp.]
MSSSRSRSPPITSSPRSTAFSPPERHRRRDPTAAPTAADKPIPEVTGRIACGIPDLDELMGGGIGAGEATVGLGPSGAGKTISGRHFVAEGVSLAEMVFAARETDRFPA